MKPKVLIVDGLHDKGIEILKKNSELLSFEYHDKISSSELLEKIAGVDALIVHSSPVSRELIEKADALKLIGRVGNGMDHIDLVAARKRRIVVINSADESADTTAEYTVLLLLAAAREFPRALVSTVRGDWERKSFLGMELSGKTAGVIGFGRIGKRVATRLQAFQMKVIATDPYVSREEAQALSVEILPLSELLKSSDIVSLHVPLLRSTYHLLNEKTFSQMKPDALLVNCARGGIVDEKAVLKALENGKLHALATDVFEAEPPPKDHPFFAHPRVVVSPHLGARTKEAQERISLSIAKKVVEFFRGGQVQNVLEESPYLLEEQERI